MRSLYKAKKQKLAIKFFEYIQKYQKDNNDKYPKYNSSNSKYYKDVFFNLLICQQGVCAYTEIAIDLFYSEKKNLWEDGKYIGEKIISDGEIEHYKARSRCVKQECDWEWDNLFLVSKHVNQAKSNKSVYDFMSPNNKNYSPEKYLSYNFERHNFFPNPNIDEQTAIKVNQTIEKLCLNNSVTIWSRRKKKLQIFLFEVYYEKYSLQEIRNKKLDEFYTAFEMSENIFKNKKKGKKYLTVRCNKINKEDRKKEFENKYSN